MPDVLPDDIIVTMTGRIYDESSKKIEYLFEGIEKSREYIYEQYGIRMDDLWVKDFVVKHAYGANEFYTHTMDMRRDIHGDVLSFLFCEYGARDKLTCYVIDKALREGTSGLSLAKYDNDIWRAYQGLPNELKPFITEVRNVNISQTSIACADVSVRFDCRSLKYVYTFVALVPDIDRIDYFTEINSEGDGVLFTGK